MFFTIIPLKGIRWNDQSILLGSKKADVESKLGIPEIVENSYYYFNSELRLDFSEKDELEFIEFLSGHNGNIQPIIYGIQAFQANADELYHILEDHNSGNVVDDEGGYSFAFPEIGIGIFRESIPDDVISLTNEMRKLGIDITKNPNIEEEQLKATHWATIALASSHYSW